MGNVKSVWNYFSLFMFVINLRVNFWEEKDRLPGFGMFLKYHFFSLVSANGQTLDILNRLTKLSCIIVSVNSCCSLYIYTLRCQYS